MNGITKIDVDYNTSVKYRGTHREIRFEVSVHAFKGNNVGYYETPQCWASYIILSEKQYTEFKEKLNNCPWNGGITYKRKLTEEHLDVPADLAELWNKPYYKIGDDFSHLWDMDRQDLFSRSYLENHIKRVIDCLNDGYSDED